MKMGLHEKSCSLTAQHSTNEKARSQAGVSFEVGGEEEDRTPDLRIANAALSQLSYPPNEFLLCHGRTANFPSCHSR